MKRKEQRCRPLQAGQMRRKESWLLRTHWIPAASARHPLCPARTPFLLWSDVRSVYCFVHSCQPVKSTHYSVFVFFRLSASESGPGTATSPASDVVKETAERLPQVPLQEHVFADCSRERILGLLAAMLPPVKPVRVNALLK